MDLGHLLQPISVESPSGENLEYDPVYTELEIAAQPGEERQVGSSIISASDPDFKEMIALAVKVLERSHDLRAAVTLAYAQLQINGLAGFASSIAYIRGCVETFWDTCHPQLDPDEDNDPTMRVNAVLRLADLGTIQRGLRLTPITESRGFGRMCLRDISVAEGEITAPPDMQVVPDMAGISAAFQDTDPERLKAFLAAAKAAQDDIRAIDAAFEVHVPGRGPDLDPVLKLLKQIAFRLTSALGEPEEAIDAEAESQGGSGLSGYTGALSRGPVGSITNQADVVNTIDRIIAYYERYEPSSPLPLLLIRAKRLVGADFLTIMRDMAPSGIENVNLIGGIRDDSDD